MPQFIQLPQAGGALPILINTRDITTARLEHNRIIVHTCTDTHESCALAGNQAVALYWYLHSVLAPSPVDFCLN